MNSSGRNGENTAPPPLHGPRLALVAVALALGTFMQVLDSTIANVALPTIAGNLGESNDTGTWVITSFAAANGVTVPLTGWLMRRFGLVTTFVASVTLFTIASALCGLAWSLPSLVVFRLLQGAVSGPMIPGSQALLIAVFPIEKRPTALSIWSMTALIGPIMGPIMGGYISDYYSWGWIFLINVPVGIFTVFTLLALMRPYNTPPVKLPIDTIGLVLLIVWVGALQVMLDLGKNADWFHSTQISILAVVAGTMVIAWLIWELTDAHPTVDLTLLRHRNFGLGTLCFCLGYAFFFASNLLMPQWLQRQEGYTATWAGLVAAPAGAIAFVMAPLTARVSNKMDMRLLASLAFVTYGASYLMRAGYSPQADFWHLMAPSLVQGLAMGTFFMAMNTIQLDGIPPHKIPSATGISNFFRITGGSFAASIVTTVWDQREALHQSRLVDVANMANPTYTGTVERMTAAGLSPKQVAGAIDRLIVNQSYLISATDLFWFSGICCFLLIGPLWLTHRPHPLKGPVAAD